MVCDTLVWQIHLFLIINRCNEVACQKNEIIFIIK